MLDGKEFTQKLGNYGEASVDVTPELKLVVSVAAQVDLLAELKSNLALSFPHITSIDLSAFPHEHVLLLNEWWEEKTGLKVDTPTKQTITVIN